MEKALSNYRASLRREYDEAYAKATIKQNTLLDRWIREIERDIHVTSCRGHRSCDYQLFVSRGDEEYDHRVACFVQIYFQSEGFQVTLFIFFSLNTIPILCQFRISARIKRG